LVATANLPVLGELRRFLPIWNISPLAERSYRLCLEHRSQYEEARCNASRKLKNWCAVKAIPQLKVWETWSNFILFKFWMTGQLDSNARFICWRDSGVYVRDCSRKLGLGRSFHSGRDHLPA
jgi:histidinol-phosphate/aromatic aminotransferase/cobyric acid decarboxylase-like protein